METKTQTEKAVAVLKRALLQGELAPGERLHIEDLSAQYEIGVTPIREALSRLASVGLVVAHGQRGFRAAVASEVDFRDIVRTRTHLEVQALRLSIRSGSAVWADAVSMALDEISSCLRRLPESFDEGEETFDRLHKNFHMALISACSSPRTQRYCGELYDEAYRHRRIFHRRSRTREVFAVEHETLAKLALARDEEAAAAYLTLHLNAPLVIFDRKIDT